VGGRLRSDTASAGRRDREPGGRDAGRLLFRRRHARRRRRALHGPEGEPSEDRRPSEARRMALPGHPGHRERLGAAPPGEVVGPASGSPLLLLSQDAPADAGVGGPAGALPRVLRTHLHLWILAEPPEELPGVRPPDRGEPGEGVRRRGEVPLPQHARLDGSLRTEGRRSPPEGRRSRCERSGLPRVPPPREARCAGPRPRRAHGEAVRRPPGGECAA
jgi:hypothetical protein